MVEIQSASPRTAAVLSTADLNIPKVLNRTEYDHGHEAAEAVMQAFRTVVREKFDTRVTVGTAHYDSDVPSTESFDHGHTQQSPWDANDHYNEYDAAKVGGEYVWASVTTADLTDSEQTVLGIMADRLNLQVFGNGSRTTFVPTRDTTRMV